MDNNNFESLAKLVKDEISSVKVELSKQINDLKLDLDDKFSTQFNVIKTNVHSLQQRQEILESRIDKTERLLHMTDLIVHGIPKTSNENLHNTFHMICDAINFVVKEFTLQAIFRVNNNVKFPPIIMKFISGPARNEFYSSYLKFKILNLSNIGFNSKDRVYIQESLSPLHAEIFRRALALRKEELLHTVFTRNGFVNVRLNKDDKAICLVDMLQLSQLVNTNNSTAKRKFNTSSDNTSPPKSNEAKYFKSTVSSISSSNPTVSSTPPISKCSKSSNTGIVNDSISQRNRRLSIGTLDNFLTKSNSLDLGTSSLHALEPENRN